MGRRPCCEKGKVKKGQWSPEEDAVLKLYMETNGKVTNWLALPENIGLNRCGKSCRLRWLNYLRPNIRHGGFTKEEEDIISKLYFDIGPRWAMIAKKLIGRTDNDIKNYWNTKLKKKFAGTQKKSSKHRDSCKGLLGTHENSHIKCTPFTITSSNCMPFDWTCNTNSTINFSATSACCSKHHHQQQQLQQQQQQRPIITNDVGSSLSSLQQDDMNNSHNARNMRSHTRLRAMETTLWALDSPFENMDVQDSRDVNNMSDNNTPNVASINEESIRSLDLEEMTYLMALPLNDFDDYIGWEELEASKSS